MYEKTGNKRSRNIILVIMMGLMISGCSLFKIVKDERHFRAERDLPQRPELPFENKEQLSRATALNLDKAEQVYYEGAEPKSKPANIILKLSKKFISTLGINTDFDPNDPKSIDTVFKGVDEANKKIREQNAQLMEDIKKANAEKAQIVRDKAAELANHEAKWKLKWGNLWFWIWFLIIALIVVSILFPPVGAFIMRWFMSATNWVAHHTVSGIQEFRDNMKNEINTLKKKRSRINGAKRKEIDAQLAEKEAALAKLDNSLHKHQTNEDKLHIKKIKNGGKIK